MRITFETLQNENITSEQLYFSSIPIDVVERYQAFLQSPNTFLSKQILYYCSIPWFGEFCQYTFDSTIPFDEILRKYFHTPKAQVQYPFNNGTCFTFIECDRGLSPSCIDWREICDGKIDCLDGGADELGCDAIDTNECKMDEYRCSNGLCIPNDFFDDDINNPDCIDSSDEKPTMRSYGYPYECQCDPMFRCEEATCRNERETSCGDGSCGTGDCNSMRDDLLLRAKLSQNANLHLSLECWIALICLTVWKSDRLGMLNINVGCPSKGESKFSMQNNCPTFFFFPAQPIVLGHVRFAYVKKVAIGNSTSFPLPEYVCYDQQLCELLSPTIRVNGSSCLLLSGSNIIRGGYDHWALLERSVLVFFLRCSLTKKTYAECPKSKPFRCANSSKCLPLNRLVDGFSDCFQGDDEQIKDSCSLPDKRYRLKCQTVHKCITIEAISRGENECIFLYDLKENNHVTQRNRIYPLSFPTLCNGFIEHVMVDSLNYTDEMDCEYWPCDNVYTRCDVNGTWNCLNGADEADCPRNPCRPDGHPCILIHNNNLTCLPLSQINDGIVDCLGAYDERTYCRSQNLNRSSESLYRCLNKTKCINSDLFCRVHQHECISEENASYVCNNIPLEHDRCQNLNNSQLLQTLSVLSYLCNLENEIFPYDVVYFTLKNHLPYPSKNTMTTENLITTTKVEVISSNVFNFESNEELDAYCNRGILVYSDDLKGKYCLCPPAYFGSRCEYQNQRVSLTLQFRTVEWSTIYNFVIMLMDNNSKSHSYEQFEYLSERDCRKKFNFYLLYSTRPKLSNHTYFLQIDIYNKTEMKYYFSMLYSIQFPFLPVHRLSFQVNIPEREFSIISKDCSLKCLHGQCMRFVNSEHVFCRCSDGYSGELCSIKNDCNCSPDSICAGTINNQSICICPLDKFGVRCYLKTVLCMSNPCQNGGRCVATDVKISESGYFCICPQRFMGSTCNQSELKMEFYFEKNIPIPQSVLIHLFDIPPSYILDKFPVKDPRQTTTISKIGFDQTSAVVYYRGTVDLIFIEFNKDYYLALVRHKDTSVNISTTIISENRCTSISQLLDNHIQNLPTWHRAKYYHTVCEKRSDLVCFYDNDQFMCLCDLNRFANCFKFDYNRVYNCFGYNYCENGGLCYQNNNTCPSSSSCFCSKCYYGTRCQFTSTGYGLSLDDILGYSIWPNVPFSGQPIQVKISTAFTIVMFVISIINSVLSILTFRTKGSLAVGCGFYLLASSITSVMTMTLFTLKFFLLVFSQMAIIQNHYFLRFNCIIMDMLLKSLLAIVDWLNGCVAIERVFTIHTGVRFNKKKSRTFAKRIIFGIYIFTLSSYIHDPIHRRLLEDNEEQRTWCIVRYSSSMQIFASSINIIHFLVPLSINIISVLFIIILMARQKLKIDAKQTHKEHLWKQFHQHKHRFLSSIILIIIAMPRLVISFMSECMKSARNPWLYLGAYFVSFISPLLVFIFFVLPSEFYRKQFSEVTINIRNTVQRGFRRE